MQVEKRNVSQSLIEQYILQFPGEVADLLNDADIKEILHYLENLPSEHSIQILLKLRGDVVAEVLELMSDDLFKSTIENIDSYTATIMLSRLNSGVRDEKLGLLSDKVVKEIKELLSYPYETAGFLMDTQIMPFGPKITVGKVLERLRSIKDRRVHNLYVVDDNEKLLGKIPLQLIAISAPEEFLENIVEESPSVHVMAHQEEIAELFKDGKLISLPVVDIDSRLLGIIRHDSLMKAAQLDATEDVLTMFGAGREERALSGVSLAVKKRLPWLQINLATAFLAASVVGAFEDTIARITVLAVFLPVVAGQSGNTGSQALAVTIRGLALRELRMDQWFQLARKEVAVGFINGVAVALTTATIVYFWASSFGLAVVIAVSMVFSTVIAGFSGAVIPIFLKSIGQDPAQSSSIVLTTVTDIVGFLSFLGLATVLGTMLGIV